MFAFPFVCSQKDTTRNRKRGAMIHTQSTPDTAMWQMLIHVVAMERLQLRVSDYSRLRLDIVLVR